MNIFRNINKNIQNFLLQLVAGVKKGFTFALPITTRSWKLKSKSRIRKHNIEMISPRANNRSPSSLKDWSQNIKQRISPVQIYLAEKKKSETFKIKLLWRVGSWLRMNASGRLNTCKSNGISSNTNSVADGWVTRTQPTFQRGIASGNGW